MTFPDPMLDRTGENPSDVPDIVPPTERSQDPWRTDTTRDLSDTPSRPLTDDERRAAEHDAPVGDRVYAPASERVPKTVPGYRDVVEHVDDRTPERMASPGVSASTSTVAQSDEPSFTRVARPTNGGNGTTRRMPSKLAMGVVAGWAMMWICAGVGVWLAIRWQRERNKPINRFRRQAMAAASGIRDRVPTTPEEAVPPSIGLMGALASLGIVLWQQSRSKPTTRVAMRRGEKTARRATEAVSELDWQHRLMQLKQRWTPGRIEREKISISRH